MIFDDLYAFGYKLVAETLMRPVPANIPDLPPMPPRRVKEPRPVQYRYLVRYHNLSLDTLVGTDSEMEMLLDLDSEVESITRVLEDMPLALDRDELRFDLYPDRSLL